MERPHPHQPGYPNRRGSLYGTPTVAGYGVIEHADSFGTDMAVRSKVPPPVAEYDEYLKGRNVQFCGTNHNIQKTGYRLRRIVVMRRNGSTWKECGDATGISAKAARSWVEMLPLGLGV